jgi:hypothetical protein
MGFLDRAKKLADQAREKAEEALAEAKSKAETITASRGSSSGSSSGPAPSDGRDPRWGTPYVPGMLGRPGWREEGLTDPAAVLPVKAREQVGVPHTVKSEIVEEPYGMGRRWSSGGLAVGLFYQLYPDQRNWSAAGGGESHEGRTLTFVGEGDRRVVLETTGLGEADTEALRATVLSNLE